KAESVGGRIPSVIKNKVVNRFAEGAFENDAITCVGEHSLIRSGHGYLIAVAGDERGFIRRHYGQFTRTKNHVREGELDAAAADLVTGQVHRRGPRVPDFNVFEVVLEKLAAGRRRQRMK